MSFRINRAKLLSRLETVSPGLSATGIIDQSSRFVFRRRRVITFNDDVACTTRSGLPKKFTGAIESAPLLAVLRKMQEKDIQISSNKDEIIISGKAGRRVGIRMDKEITLPIETLEVPNGSGWREVPEEFSTAIGIVHESASTDHSKFHSVCVHITPKWVEASNGLQSTRYRFKTGFDRPTLVRADGLRPILALDMTEMAETEEWLHFRNMTGMVYSVRLWYEPYPDMNTSYKVTGSPAKFPKGIVDDADLAEIFSKENADSNYLIVDMKPGHLLLRGVGNSGWYEVPKKVNYKGPHLVFGIGPGLLTEITKKYNDCEISKGHLKVNGGRWTFVTTLGVPSDKKEEVDDVGIEDDESDENSE